MKRIALAVSLLALALSALAAEEKPPPSNDPMAGWKPRKVTKEAQDRKEIDALLKAMDEAGKKGDVEAAAALIDFPVLMVTDDSKGEAMGGPWTREEWIQRMSPMYARPMTGMTIAHRPTVFLVSDSLATVSDQWTMTVKGTKISGRSSMIAVRIGGEWKAKAMMESGWGDSMDAEAGAATGGSAQPTK